jgi:uncharacterized protein YciI
VLARIPWRTPQQDGQGGGEGGEEAIVLGGPFADRTGSLVIVAADNAERVHEMFRSDPWTEQDVLVVADVTGPLQGDSPVPTISLKKRPFTHQAVHLPECPVAPEVYHRLYSFNGGVDDCMEETAEWQESRLRPGLSEEDVYRLLPSAPDFEYGGYLTRTRIRFLRCDAFRSNTRKSQPCTFHSHPTELSYADLPSVTDVYMFLAYRHLRAVTVGATKIWVWDKTKQTLPTVQKLGSWYEQNLLKEAQRLERKDPFDWHELFFKLALRKLGLVWPRSRKALQQHGPEMLEGVLKIKVREFPRTRER